MVSDSVPEISFRELILTKSQQTVYNKNMKNFPACKELNSSNSISKYWLKENKKFIAIKCNLNYTIYDAYNVKSGNKIKKMFAKTDITFW